MLEKASTDYLREWLEGAGYLVYARAEFNVRNTNRRRPDMVVISKKAGYHSALEIKRSRGKDIHKAYKIVDYATDYCNGAEYLIKNKKVDITNFLVATDASKEGKLFDSDVLYDEKRREKLAVAYDGWGRGRVEPYCEYAKTGEFVRGIWRGWKEREGMKHLKIGILLSSINDKEKTLKRLRIPKLFVVRFDERRGRWGQQWREL